MEFRILDLSSDDDFAIFQRQSGKLYTELFGAAFVPSASAYASVREQARVAATPNWCFVGESATDDEPVAFFTLAESFALFAGGRYLILGELWVHPAHRSRGVGEAVVEFCRGFCRERGYRRVDVTAPPDPKWDRSFQFYVKRGFSPTGRKLKLMISET